MKNINALQLGTFDVSNFGDLIFPIIMKKELESTYFTIIPTSPVGGKVEHLSDAPVSVGISDISKTGNNIGAVLIGGGNIIHIQPTKNELYTNKERQGLAYSDLWAGPAYWLPEDVPIIWNAPGVPSSFNKAQKKVVQHALQRADYISVRDPQSRAHLIEICPDLNIAVVPDTAWQIDKLWPYEELKGVRRDLFKRLGTPEPKRSIIIHLNRRYFEGKSTGEIASVIDDLAQKLDVLPILIGFAPCHGDDVLATEVGAAMHSNPVVLHQASALKEIAACIASANFYAGSSMHGLIVSSSYGVPGVCIAKRNLTKFAGLLSLSNLPNFVVENWDAAAVSLLNMNINKRKLELRSIREDAHKTLDLHWESIRKILLSQKAKNHNISQEQYWRGLSTYHEDMIEFHCKKGLTQEFERKITDRQLRAADRDQKKKHQRLSDKNQTLESKIKTLESKIKIMKQTFSWKATLPLRKVSSVAPRASLRALSSIKFLAHLPSHVKRNFYRPKNLVVNNYPHDIKEQIISYHKKNRQQKAKIVYYTAVFGNYDTLLPPDIIDPDIDYVCFSNQAQNDYGIWQIKASPYYHTDPTRVARYIKTHPHELFPNHEVAIWLDANIRLRKDVKTYISKLDSAHQHFGLIPHPHRSCFFEEAEACKRLKKDNSKGLNRQIEYYRNNGIEPHSGLYETGFMIVCLKNASLREMFVTWWQHIEQYSRRDQLALSWALQQHKANIANLLPMGTSVRDSEDFIYYTHDICKNIEIEGTLKALGKHQNPFLEEPFSSVKAIRLEETKSTTIDIVICVYNALEDVTLCLNAVYSHLLLNHRIIIVNDLSDEKTSDFLRAFSEQDRRIVLLENEINLGYTQSANRGLSTTTADFCIVLNSDTIVCDNWAIKLANLAVQHDNIGIVGPLSNAAGAQSIPDIKKSTNNTAINSIPNGTSIQDIDLFLENTSPSSTIVYVPLIHGFCIGIKRQVMDKIGLFDAENFARYYGEENDYCLRASKAGYSLAVATNTFVYHRKSRSIVEEERIIHMDKAGQRLRELYSSEKIKLCCLQGEQHPWLIEIRARAADIFVNSK